MKKLIRRVVAVASAAFFIACGPVAAQWQVPLGEIPIGRGSGTGFSSIPQSNTVPVRLVCDGATDNTATIVAAYNAAVAAGGHKVLEFPSSSSPCMTGSLFLQTNRTNGISFKGQGAGNTTLKLMPGTVSCGILLLRWADNTSISDMSLDGSGCTANADPVATCFNCTNAYIERIQVYGFRGTATGFNSVQNGAIRNNEIFRSDTSPTENYAILALSGAGERSVNLQITNNIVRNSLIQMYDVDYSVVSNNVVNGSGFGALIGVGHGHTNVISGNNLSNGVGIDSNGVAVQGIENVSSGTAITGNTVNNVAGGGIDNFGSNVTMSGNTVIDCGTVTSGPAKNSKGFGLASALTVPDQNASGSTITGNTVKNVAGTTCEYGYGENVATMTGISVFNNNFEGASLGPFNLDPASATRVWYYDQTDNRFHDRNASGVLATTVVPSFAAANSFVYQIGADGVVLKAQPFASQISGFSTDGTLAANSDTQFSSQKAVKTYVDGRSSASVTLTNKTISGASNTISNIANASLTNSSVTVNGTAISLGASGTVTAAAGTLTGATLASSVTSASLGTITPPSNLLNINGVAGSALALRMTHATGQDSVFDFGPLNAWVEYGANANGDWTVSHFGQAAGVFFSIRAGSVSQTLVLQGGGVSVGTATAAGAGSILANASIKATTYMQSGAVAVASLPACAAGTKGARHFVTDANATFTAGIGAVVAAGGANNVPVTCDGTNWRIGANDNLPAHIERKFA